jgi:hypothetical protein
MLSDYCDLAQRVMVGRLGLFWANHVIIFLGQPNAPPSLHGTTIMGIFSSFRNQLITHDSAINPSIMEIN